MPGPYIKYFLKAIKQEGLYKMACAFDDHFSYVQSIFDLQKNENEEPNLFIGKTEGEIVYPRGQKNFGLLGLDPWFTLNCTNKTYA